MKARITLKARKQFGTIAEGDLLIIYNNIFDTLNGIAFYSIDRNQWALESYEQWTGLTTRDKKEIYVNDTVKIQLPLGGFWGKVKKEEIGIIKFEPEKGGFIVEFDSKNHGGKQPYVSLDVDIAFNAEIIRMPNLNNNLNEKK